MANATLEMMQEIEQAAEEVLASYKGQAQELRDQLEQELSQLAAAEDEKTQQELADVERSSEEKLAVLQADLEVTVAQNEAAVRSVLTDKKDALVQTIVEKVVATYGH